MKPRTVLVADDEPMFRDVVSQMLEGAGYKVLEAKDGLDGWEKLVAVGADMAVLDLNMPRMDGLALTRRIRQDERFKDLPILMLTVRALIDEQVSGFDRGADDYITKPFDRKMLLARLKVLERRILGR